MDAQVLNRSIPSDWDRERAFERGLRYELHFSKDGVHTCTFLKTREEARTQLRERRAEGYTGNIWHFDRDGVKTPVR